jgi:NADH-ubiquinone oxidoreductase chain 5
LPAILSLLGVTFALLLYNKNPEILINLTESSLGQKIYAYLNGKY